MSLDDLIGSVVPVTAEVRLCLRGDLNAEIARLEEQLADVPTDSLGVSPDAQALAERIVELQEEAHKAEATFRFRSIGQRAWRDLLAKHPPTTDHRKSGADYHLETFPVAAIAASLVEPPDATVEQVERLFDVLNIHQTETLWHCCLKANLGDGGVGESKAASDVLRRLRPNGVQPSS